MSLAAISGKVSSITNGSGIANYVSKAVFGNSSFLRNDERGVDKVASAISNIQNIDPEFLFSLSYRMMEPKQGNWPEVAKASCLVKWTKMRR